MDIKLNPIRYGAVASTVFCLLNFATGQVAEKKSVDSGAASSGSAVIYFEKSKMDAAFAKGAVLFDGSDGRNYQVHASRREQPGQAEVHGKYSDIIYVLQGTATFVTGGEAVDGKTVAPDEIRANSIRGGETRKISQGDVIILPHGVPHQFVEVTNPFLYLVVKVR
jgi:quercetin dioxygenase-like cupin family protein